MKKKKSPIYIMLHKSLDDEHMGYESEVFIKKFKSIKNLVTYIDDMDIGASNKFYMLKDLLLGKKNTQAPNPDDWDYDFVEVTVE